MSDKSIENSTVSSQGGSPIQVVRAGHGGPNILELHSAGSTHQGNERLTALLGELGVVYAPNLYDLIASCQHRGVQNPTMGDMFNEFSRLGMMDQRRQTGVVSESWGADLGWLIAHKSRVDWMVAASPTGWPLERSRTEWIREFMRMMLDASQAPEDLKKKDSGPGLFIRQLLRTPRAVIHGLRMAANSNAKDLLPGNTQPVDLLRGLKDRYIPLWSTQKILDMLPNGRMEIVSEQGHLWSSFQPEIVANKAIQLARPSSRLR